MTGNKRVCFLTLGCRVNQYESDAISEALENRSVATVPFGNDSDIVIINTCSVTAESDRKSRQMVRRAAKRYPDAPIIVCGCYAQKDAASLFDITGVAAVCGNSGKSEIADIAVRLLSGDNVEYSMRDIHGEPYDTLSLTKPYRERAYIKIEDGCENKCAYCIIPSLRGAVRSRDPESIICEAKALIKAGCHEIVLVGIETASYGKDSGDGNSLASLLEKLDSLDGICRLSMGSLDPTVMKPEFLSKIAALPSVLPHFHISLQSGTTATLNRMRRKYSAEQAERYIANIREYMPEAMLSADVIVGFPGETDADFEATVEFCKRARFMHLHIFPYSPREGTEAATMRDQIPENIKHARLARLSEVQRKIKAELIADYAKKHAEAPVNILFEQPKNGMMFGHTEHNAEAYVAGACDLAGEVRRAVVISNDGDSVVCKLI